MKKRLAPVLFILVLLAGQSCTTKAQTNPNLETGLKAYGSYAGGNIDNISISTGNLNLHIPLFSYPQRGSMPGSLSIGYNGKNWFVYQHCEYSICTDQWKWTNSNVHGVYINVDGTVGISWVQEAPGVPADVFTAYTSDGGTHMMTGTGGAYYSTDGSGIFYGGTISTSGPVRTKDGVQPLTSDNNGNWMTSQAYGIASYPGTLTTDTLGRNLNPTGTSTTDYSGCVAPASPTVISGAYISTYPGQGSTSRELKVCSATYTATTNFHATDPTGSPAITEGSETATFVVSVVLYNGSSWSTSPAWGFDYDSSGDLAVVTEPTGGTISYTWGNTTLCTGSTESLTQHSLGVQTRTVNAMDGTGSHQWMYATGNIGTTTPSVVTDPDHYDTAHYLTEFGACGYYETKTQWFSGSYTSGAVLKTTTTDYQSKVNPYGALLPDSNVNVLPIRVTTTWPNGQTTKVEKDYDSMLPGGYSAGNVIALREYDYGNNTPGPLLRTTTYTYEAQTISAFMTANLLDRVASVIVTDGGGTQMAKTTYTYDDFAVQASSVTSQHDNTKANSPRGNHTGTCNWLSTTGGNVCTSTVYYDTGMPYSSTDPNGNTTSFTYSSTDNGAYMTQTKFPDTTSPTLSHHIISGTYDFNTGELNNFTDQNGNPTSYAYDLLGRITSATFPDGGLTTFSYNDVALSAYVERDETIAAGKINMFRVGFDGLGRRKQTQLRSDVSTDYVDYTYDEIGRIATVSNPYRTTGDPTYGITTHKYDPLSREITVIPPDGSATANNVTTQYCGGYTMVTDQTNHWRRSSADGLGRLIEVDEPNSSATVNVCPGSGEPIYATTYTYDGLNNLKTVVQNGSRNRSFVFDSLKRLTSSTNPEAGTVSYAYDANGNVLTKSDARGTAGYYYYDALNRLIAKRFSDATPPAYYLFDGAVPTSSATTATGSVTISGTEKSFVPDCPNPPCGTTYDAGTMSISLGGYTKSITFQHGSTFTTLATSFAAAFNVPGSPVTATSSAGLITFTSVIPGIIGNYTIATGYVDNYPGEILGKSFTLTPSGANMTGATGTCAASGVTIAPANSIGRRSAMCDAGGGEAWSFDTMGRELSEQRNTSGFVKSTSYAYNADGSLLSLTYPTGRTITYTPNAISQPISAIDTANSINYATAASYAPQGSLTALTLGSASGFTGLQLNDSYNTRLQPTEIKAWSTAGVAMDLVYGFTDPNNNNYNNGNVIQISNSKDPNRSQIFTYDQVNRINTAKTSATTGSNCWSYTYGYDAWANLLSSSPMSGYTCTQSNLSLGVNTKNQITNTGFTYDASGNVLADGVTTYAWDAESQIKTAAGVNYTYDGDGNRLKKSSGKIYWYGAGSEILDESDSSGNITDEYVFFGGKRIAHRVISPAAIFYYAEDFLGTSRVITTSNGTVCYESDFQPFGGENPPITNTCPQNYKFTGKERDTETGNDNFGARYFSPTLGRWLSPDWSAVPAPVPYATLTNPQTLNLYQYVGNNPETAADIDGHLWPIGERDPTFGGDDPNVGVTSPAIFQFSTGFGGSDEYLNTLNQAQGVQESKKQPQNQNPPDQVQQVIQAQADAKKKAIAEQTRTPSEQDKKDALVKAGKMGDAGVKAGLVVVAAEAAVAVAVVGGPPALAAGRTAGQAAAATAETYVPGSVAVLRQAPDFVRGAMASTPAGVPQNTAGYLGRAAREAYELAKAIIQ